MKYDSALDPQSLLQSLFDSESIGVFAFDDQGRITLWNPTMERLAGMPAVECITRPLADVLPDVIRQHPELIASVLNGVEQRISRVELIRRADNVGQLCDIRILPVTVSNGSAGGAAIVHPMSAADSSRQRMQDDKARLQAIVEHIPIIAVARFGDIVELNKEFRTVMGYTSEDIRSVDSFFEELCGENAQLVRAIYEKDRKRGFPRKRVIPIFTKKKNARQVEIIARVFEAGEIWLFHDITERKRNLEALQTSERAIRTLIANIPGAVFQCANDEYRSMTFLSDAIRDITGYAAPEFIDNARRKFGDIIHPEDKPQLQAVVNAALQAEESYEVEYRIIDSDGAVRWVHEKGQGVATKSDQVTRIGGVITDMTHQRQAEKELLARTSQFETLTKVAPAGIFQTNADGECIYVNDRWLEFAGMQFSEAMGHGWANAVHPDDRARVTEEWSAATDSDSDFQSEFRFRTPQGMVSWLTVSATKIDDNEGGVSGFLGTVTDITDRKNVEKELRTSTERFELAVSGANDGIWDWDVLTNTVVYSIRFRELLGYSEEEYPNEFASFDNALHPEDHDRVLNDVRLHLEERVPYHVEYRLQTKRKGYRWFLARGQAIWDDDGKPVRMAGSISDITERRQANELVRIIFEQSSDAHLLFDETGIIDCNNATLAMLRCNDKSQLLGLHPAKLSPEYQPDGRRSMEKSVEMDALAREHGHHRFDWIHRKFDGEEFPVEVTLTPLVVNAKNTLLVVWHDITERKNHEIELLRAKDEAEAANRAKSEFLATMSHEIRTPMNGVIGMTSLLIESELSPEQRESVEIIQSSGKILVAIINDILDFSKIESGKLQLESAPIDVRRCMEDILDMFAHKAREKRIELIYQFADATPEWIIGDIIRLRQIFVNLIGNALKFTSDGETELRVRPLSAERDGITLEFAVRDTGIGIAPEKHGELFKAFTQVDASTTREYGGTGLGLTICERLVHLMGGTMWLESALGQGSTFYFTLKAQAAKAPPNPAFQAALTKIRGKRILIVDAYTARSRYLENLVCQWHAIPRIYATAQEALEVIGSDGVDIALVDESIGATKKDPTMHIFLRKAHQRSVPVILTHSVSLSDDDDIPNATGYAGVLVKPVRSARLLETLAGAVAKRRDVENEGTEPLQAPSANAIADVYPLRILLAEDNAVNQKIAVRIFDKLGYSVQVAHNGAKALEALRTARYDIVFMDIQMPEMDGLEATRHIIGEWEQAERPHIIAMTANAMQGDRERCLEAGMDDYIAKPITKRDIQNIIKRWGSSAQTQNEA